MNNLLVISNKSQRDDILQSLVMANESNRTGNTRGRYIKIISFKPGDIRVKRVDHRREKSSLEEISLLIQALYPKKLVDFEELFGNSFCYLGEEDRIKKLETYEMKFDLDSEKMDEYKPIEEFLKRVSLAQKRKSICAIFVRCLRRFYAWIRSKPNTFESFIKAINDRKSVCLQALTDFDKARATLDS